MDEQTTNYKTPAKSFNVALFLGCCTIALSIVITGQAIAQRIPDSLYGNLNGSFSGTLMDSNNGYSSREFMSDWEAASFLMLSIDELEYIIESGEFDGMYTILQTERTVAVSYDKVINENGIAEERVEYDTLPFDHRIFSREKLTEWLLGRIDNGQ